MRCGLWSVCMILSTHPSFFRSPRWRRRDNERWKIFVLSETTSHAEYPRCTACQFPRPWSSWRAHHGPSLCLSRRRHLPTVLVRVQPGVIPLAGEQLRMRPVFDNAPLLDHQNGVR